ncbi:hypothetical protein [Desulfonatronum sp. SC1]|uniref:hypothetical protein n=1 Tax=Desulfonatronum sp. SC1 TaxID=2109626 RepID=UPI000D31855F|nr:hypothetical protein [Desulfonatronum sp. SC1]PTN31902.1 hypothetical protein C6366_17470 [Desulfonatronum sp. SC1]
MPEDPLLRLPHLYADMENRYADIAAYTGLTCADCPDNCCTSYFQHHTHVEWAYLWQGLATLPDTRLREVRSRAAEYVEQARGILAEQRAPDIMCPLNEGGRCILYAHRLMICRLHGVPNVFTLPNGIAKEFPGCFRSQELTASNTDLPKLDRTAFYHRLAELEMDYLRSMTQKPAKVRLTLAEMIHQGPPV